jgi:hypothetical protein
MLPLLALMLVVLALGLLGLYAIESWVSHVEDACIEHEAESEVEANLEVRCIQYVEQSVSKVGAHELDTSTAAATPEGMRSSVNDKLLIAEQGAAGVGTKLSLYARLLESSAAAALSQLAYLFEVGLVFVMGISVGSTAAKVVYSGLGIPGVWVWAVFATLVFALTVPIAQQKMSKLLSPTDEDSEFEL